jgi:hypothetical protein
MSASAQSAEVEDPKTEMTHAERWAYLESPHPMRGSGSSGLVSLDSHLHTGPQGGCKAAASPLPVSVRRCSGARGDDNWLAFYREIHRAGDEAHLMRAGVKG